MLANRGSRVVVTVLATLLLLLLLGTVAFADGQDGQYKDKDGERAPVCVEGVIIDHREHPVDGTKTDPVLVVRAIRVQTDENAVDAAEAMTSTVAVTDTVPVEPTQEMTPTQEIAPELDESLAQGLVADVDEHGRFKFKELPEGSFDFVVDLPDGWEGIVPLAARGDIARTGVTELTENKRCYPILFKLRRVFDVIVIKWEEGWDGTVTPGEGWKISAEPYKDPFAKEQWETTDASGQTGFILTAGDWIIKEHVKEGWKPITPSAVQLHLDPYAQAGAMDPIVFKNLTPPCYSKIVVRKIGYGLSPEGGEVQLGPLAGWKIILKRADGHGGPAVQTTDASGMVTFDGLKPGVYKVEEEVQPGWEVVGDNPLTVVHMDCETTNVVFNNREIKGKLWIYGTKWYKPLKDQKGPLVGLSGWEISATLLGTEQTISTYTDALGRYSFSEEELSNAGIGFPGATVKVCEVERDDWKNVTPECVHVTFPYPVPLAYDGVKVDFVNAQLCEAYHKGTMKPSDPWYGACKDYGKEYDKDKNDCKDGCKEYPKEGPQCKDVYTVHRGDTLAKIAAKYHVSMYAIARVNHIKNLDLIYTGQKLCIP